MKLKTMTKPKRNLEQMIKEMLNFGKLRPVRGMGVSTEKGRVLCFLRTKQRSETERSEQFCGRRSRDR